ncbi:MAG: dipeptide ABC transporter ATP-binding protein [Pseudomonadota bacterium]|nr:dipeptide ABC transporter ATP-binding protein [Pseudomonadota bacterium]
MTPLLRVNNLAIRAGQTTLVNGISFDIHRGEIFALVGESGSGKSLTSLAIMRLLADGLQISGGEVWLDQDNLFALSEMQMNGIRGRRVAMIFQEPQSSLNPVQTVGRQIAEVLTLHRGQAPRADVVVLLDEVGIPDPEQRIDWYPHQLSGGQKQRVMIAMALACEPDLLIADEPTTALDVTIQKQILELLAQLKAERDLGVLLITHDMGVVAEMADRIAVMRHGDILEQAPRSIFFSAPQHEYSRQLIHALPQPDDYLTDGAHAPLLTMDNAKVWFAQRKGILQRIAGHTRAVDGVSLTIGRGETLALVGESGSGKSTLGRAILRLESLTEGQIHFDGQRIDTLSQKAFQAIRKRIQVIFQDPFSSMNPRMTVRQIIEEGMLSLGVMASDKSAQREARIRELLERVGLEAAHLDRYPHEFSGGQRQRIAIARAIAVEPELIICDEPTSALDVSIRGQVLALLQELQQEMGLSYLFITHDLSIIPHLAHRVAVMRHGVLVEQGATQQIMTSPQHDYTRTLLAAVPKIPEHV